MNINYDSVYVTKIDYVLCTLLTNGDQNLNIYVIAYIC